MPVFNRLQMQSARRKRSGNIGKVVDEGTVTLSKKSLGRNNHKYYRKDPAISAMILKNPDQGCIALIWVIVKLDTCYELVPLILPLQRFDQRNCMGSGTEVKMDGPEPVFSSPEISFDLDMRKEQTSQRPPNHMCCEKTFTSSSSASNGLFQSQNRGHDTSTGAGSADLVEDGSKVDKPVKRSSRKKIKKKRRQQKKSSSCSGDRVVINEQGIHGISALETHGISAPETCSDIVSALGDGCSLANNLSVNAKNFSVTPHDIIMEKVNNEESSNDTVNLSATTSKATSCSGDVELLETEASLHVDSGEDAVSEQLGIDGRPLFATTSAIQTLKVTLCSFGGQTLDAHLKRSNTHAEVTSGRFSDEYDALVLDPSDDWNNDVGINGSDDVNNPSSLRKENVVHPSDSEALDCNNCGTSFTDVTSRNGNSSCRTSYDSDSGTASSDNCCSEVVAGSNNNSERTECGHKGCSNGGIFSVILGKKGRQDRKYSMGSNGTRRVSSGINGYGRAGKETNYSVQQKVQKTDLDECFGPMDRDHVCSKLDASKGVSSFARLDTCIGLMEDDHKNPTGSACSDEISAHSGARQRSATIGANTFSLNAECDNSRNKVSEKLKRETSSGSKIENGQNFRKGSHTGKAMRVRPTKMNVPQKEALDISLRVNSFESVGTVSRSSSFLNDTFNLSSSEPLQDSQISSQETRPLGDVIAVASNMDAQASQNQTGTLSAASDHLETLEVEPYSSSKFCKDKLGDSCLQTCNENTPAEQQVYASHVGNGNPDHKCGSILQRWVPVVSKYAETLDNLSNSHLDEPFSEGCNLMSTKEEQLSTESHSHVPLTNAGATFLVPCSGSINYTLSEDEVTCEHRCDAPAVLKEQTSMHVASSGQAIHKLNELGNFINVIDSSKISQAINDAYRMQILSEGVQLATGSPIAEFERFLHSASPVLVQTSCVRHCNVCSGDWLIGDSLCRDQIPDISLGSLWQWYEVPGSYGLEVKAEDFHSSKRFFSDRFQFRAYFVPLLSAVQLFGLSSSSMSACNAMSNDCLSPPGQGQLCKPSVRSACVSDSELLFEYFESEQPQKRQPLHEKIQELIRGNATSNIHIFGDPLKLESLHLHDLHPSSWYSVAWYPIYRIPDGNFRAAFLTYHSLGHFVQSTTSDPLGGGTSIASPVVGLQSYNAQGECWFQPRNFMMMQVEGPLSYNPSEVLKERLRTLEQTAHVMARASVHKSDHKLVNRQPDYEFFLSRKR
ncbi:hypothetical protein AAC387_Pa01g0468 [Persea americana]